MTRPDPPATASPTAGRPCQASSVRCALYRRLGGPEVLELADLETPEPAPGEVRVRVAVSGVNPTDYKARAAGAGKEIPFPYVVPHQDGAGTVDAVGSGVDPARVGERVWLYLCQWQRQHGSAAQWICLPATQAVRLPDEADYDLGASLGIPALTAHRALFADGDLAGRTVLVAGGAGAVGHFAIELARWAGARVVTTVSSERKAQLARAAGADVVVDYRRDDAAAAIRHAVPHGVDRVVEVDLGANLALDLAVCRPGATVLTYAALPHDPVVPVRALMTANLRLEFLLVYTMADQALHAAVSGVSQALAAGALTALPVTRFPLDQVAEAHRAAEQGVVGKVLVEIP